MADTLTKHGFHDWNDDEGNWHVFPEGDSKDHVLDRRHDCFCEPMVINETDRRVYIHSPVDGRDG